MEINATDSAIAEGGVSMYGDYSVFDKFYLGYDNNADDDIYDAGDDLILSNAVLYDTTCTVKHDHAGNLIDDCTYVYAYDAKNRLVKVQSSLDSGATVIQTAEFDGTGRDLPP